MAILSIFVPNQNRDIMKILKVYKLENARAESVTTLMASSVVTEPMLDVVGSYVTGKIKSFNYTHNIGEFFMLSIINRSGDEMVINFGVTVTSEDDLLANQMVNHLIEIYEIL